MKLKLPKVPKVKNPEVSDPNAQRFLVTVVGGFIGMIMALAWNNILVTFIHLLGEKIPVLSLFGGLFAAILVTIIGVVVGVSFFNKLNTGDHELHVVIDEKKEPDEAAPEEAEPSH